MNQNQTSFDAAKVGAKFKKTCIKFDELLAQANQPELTNIRKKLRE